MDDEINEDEMNEDAVPQDIEQGVQWPNKHPVVDGVVPVSETPQDAEFGRQTDEELDREMEV